MQDGKRSSQFEHTMVVTETGIEVRCKSLMFAPQLAAVMHAPLLRDLTRECSAQHWDSGAHRSDRRLS